MSKRWLLPLLVALAGYSLSGRASAEGLRVSVCTPQANPVRALVYFSPNRPGYGKADETDESGQAVFRVSPCKDRVDRLAFARPHAEVEVPWGESDHKRCAGYDVDRPLRLVLKRPTVRVDPSDRKAHVFRLWSAVQRCAPEEGCSQARELLTQLSQLTTEDLRPQLAFKNSNLESPWLPWFFSAAAHLSLGNAAKATTDLGKSLRLGFVVEVDEVKHDLQRLVRDLGVGRLADLLKIPELELSRRVGLARGGAEQDACVQKKTAP